VAGEKKKKEEEEAEGKGSQEKEGMEVVLRHMRESDIKKIMKCAIQEDPFVVTFPYDYYKWYIDRFGKYCYVMEHKASKHIMGYLLGKCEGRPLRGHVSAVAIDVRYRGRGWARKMMNVIERQSTMDKCLFVDLYVDERNSNAFALYKHLGYSVYRKVIDYYDKGRDAYDMRKATILDPTRSCERREQDIHTAHMRRWNVF